MKIAIFDSGVGGVTVLYRALSLLPREDYIYYADTSHVPYGEKPKDEVRRYVFEAAEFIAKKRVKALVIACNAATSAAAKELRCKYDFPIIGIEPAVKPAVLLSQDKGKRVLVLSTHLTLKEEKYNNLITELDDDHIIDGLALPGLVEFAERFEFDPNVVMPYLQQQLSSYELSQYGTVVLGCTHFPLYRDMLKKLLPEQTEIVDGGIGTARNLKRILEEKNIINEGTGKIEYYVSGVRVEDGYRIAQFAKLLERMGNMN